MALDPYTIAALTSGAINIFGGLLGGGAAAEEAAKAEQIIKDSIARIEALQIPDITKKIIYDQYMSVGDFNPQMLDKVIEENAPLALVKEDPRYRAKMQATLGRLEQTTRGPSAEFELGLEKARKRASQDVLSKIASIESESKRTGTFGAGASLAAKLKAIQTGADRQSMEGLEAAALSERSQSQNLQNFINSLSADQASQMATQTENVRARNLRDEQLMRNAIAREEFNKRAANAAALRNLDERQRAADANTGINIGEQRRVGYEAPMNMFNMQRSKLGLLNDAYGNLADVYTSRGQAKANMYGQMASGVAGMVTPLAVGGFGPGSFSENVEKVYGAKTASNNPSFSFSFPGLAPNQIAQTAAPQMSMPFAPPAIPPRGYEENNTAFSSLNFNMGRSPSSYTPSYNAPYDPYHDPRNYYRGPSYQAATPTPRPNRSPAGYR